MEIRILATIATLATAILAAAQTTWHVDSNCGDDAWTGLSEVCAAPNGPKRTIQAAMAEAVSGDEIVLADGVYRPIDEEGGPIDFAGRELTLRSRSGIAANCIIWTSAYGSATYFGRTVLVNGGAAATLHGLTFLGGPWYECGAVGVDSSTLVVEDCEFKDCNDVGPGYASYGGAVEARRATALFANSRFVSNGCGVPDVLSSGGGAVYATESSVEFIDCEFRGNHACADRSLGFDPGYGGAVIAGPDAYFERCIFSGNLAAGGAGAVGASAPVFVDCDFVGNRAGGSGGAVSATNATFERCRFVGNQGRNRQEQDTVGGAIECRQDVSIANCLFVDNVLDDEIYDTARGGALSCRGARIVNSTFLRNQAEIEGGAIYASGPLVVASCIFRENFPDQLSGPSGAVLDASYSNIQGGYPGEGNIDADPLFLDPAAGDFRLGAGSPCIDAGDSSAVPAGVILDLAGVPRFRDDPTTPDTGKGPAPIVDMGAYEFQPVCYADCDGSGELDTFDFLCFQNHFAASAPLADCDGSGLLDFFDFLCFQNAFAAGCP